MAIDMLPPQFWHHDAKADAEASIARGKLDFLLLRFRDGSEVFLDSSWGMAAIELNLDSLKHVSPAELGISDSDLAVHGQAIRAYLEAYNGRILAAMMKRALSSD